MRANTLKALLNKKDRIAVSNITGREASKVSIDSQRYSSNIVAGWALGKGGQTPQGSIPVFGTFAELMEKLPQEKQPNKVIVYSPPEAVYGEVKEIITYGGKIVETIFIITENVSIEVTAKINQISRQANIDVIGCNTLGTINVHDHIRVGAIGGSTPEESFKPGSSTIISNSGNMTNTMASYLLTSGIGTSFAISTGKDVLILSPLKDLLALALKDKSTKLIILYIEPGGVYEKEAVEMLKQKNFHKPIIVYVAGKIIEDRSLSLGHAGAVVEGKFTSASSKMAFFDEYFGLEPFDAKKQIQLKKEKFRGIRITTLHHLPQAASLIYTTMGWEKDTKPHRPLRLNPWFINLEKLPIHLPSDLVLEKGIIPEPYAAQATKMAKSYMGLIPSRRNMRSASHASSNDGAIPRIYGYPLTEAMKKLSFAGNLILYWTGELPRFSFEEKLMEMSISASLTNGPGTISAQGAKLSTSAGNSPNTAMIATLSTIGTIHGGNGSKATRFLLDVFRELNLKNPYDPDHGLNLNKIVKNVVSKFMKTKIAAKEAGMDYERIPCLGHPVFRTEAVNFDPREQIIYKYIKDNKKYNIFLEFYHILARELKEASATKNVLAVNLDAAIACVCLGITWPLLKEKKITEKRAVDIPFLVFSLGRAGGGAGEFLDHQDFGQEMDMRIPVSECQALSRPRKL